MEILEFLEKMNDILERSFAFRAFKAVLAFYLVIMTITVAIAIYRLVKFGYFVMLQTGQGMPSTKGKMQMGWEEIKERLESQNPNEWKAAILEIARMLNEVLGIIGYEGVLLGDKLDNMLPSQLDNLEEVKEANKVKNRIVNNKEFVISQEDARKTVGTFTKALRFLDAIS